MQEICSSVTDCLLLTFLKMQPREEFLCYSDFNELEFEDKVKVVYLDNVLSFAETLRTEMFWFPGVKSQI